jgi:hypothetical protein
MMGEFEERGCTCSIDAPLQYSPVEVIVLPRSDDIAEEQNGRLYNERPELVLLLDSYDATMCVHPCLHAHIHAQFTPTPTPKNMRKPACTYALPICPDYMPIIRCGTDNTSAPMENATTPLAAASFDEYSRSFHNERAPLDSAINEQSPQNIRQGEWIDATQRHAHSKRPRAEGGGTHFEMDDPAT